MSKVLEKKENTKCDKCDTENVDCVQFESKPGYVVTICQTCITAIDSVLDD